jgi:hypothetical protein
VYFSRDDPDGAGSASSIAAREGEGFALGFGGCQNVAVFWGLNRRASVGLAIVNLNGKNASHESFEFRKSFDLTLTQTL